MTFEKEYIYNYMDIKLMVKEILGDYDFCPTHPGSESIEYGTKNTAWVKDPIPQINVVGWIRLEDLIYLYREKQINKICS